MTDHTHLGIAPPGVYEVVLRTLRPLHGLRILDVPCASGGFVQQLSREGATCIAVDIVNSMQYKPAVIADMNYSFPFTEAYFDVITCLEGIEHIQNPFHVTHEFYRLLRPGGRLILSTPNIHNVRSRIKFLLRGTLFWFDTKEIDGVGHVSVVPYFILKHILKAAGFEDVSVRPNRMLGPYLPSFVSSAMQRFLSKPTEQDRELNSATLLSAECLIVFARKPAEMR